jgi:hypothetical protein
MVMQACRWMRAAHPGVQPGAPAAARRGEQSVRAVLERIDAIEALGIAPAAASPAYWRTLATGSRRACRCPNTPPSGTPPGWPGGRAAMTPHPRSRLRARLVLAGLSACGLAALAWASFVHPLPRLTYNPSDSVAVGWYRVDPLDHRTSSLPRPLSVGIVLVPLPAEAAALAAQRGYLPTRVPLLKRVGAVAPQEVCIATASPHRRRAFGRRAACRPLGPAAAILAAVPPFGLASCSCSA